MIRTKLLVALASSLILITALLALHLYETAREIYLHKRLDSMHHEYITVLTIKQAVTKQMKEAMNIVVLGHDAEIGAYIASQKYVTATFEELTNSIFDELVYMEVEDNKKHDEDERDKAQLMKNKYHLINSQLSGVISLSIKDEQYEDFKRLMWQVEKNYDGFVHIADEWITEEQQEIIEVEKKFSFMTKRNTLILVVGSLVTMVISMSMFLSIIFFVFDPKLKEFLKGTQRVSSGDLETPIPLSGNDELTLLAGAFNQMTEKLRISQSKLLEQSYYSGVSEIMSGVLHNIKNSFSPFIIDTEVVQRHLNNLKIDKLEPAIQELSLENLDKKRRHDLVEYVNLIVLKINDVSEKISEKITMMQKRASLIENIMEDQSKFGRPNRFVENIPLSDLIYDSLALINKKLLNEIPVIIYQSVKEVGSVRAQRIVFLQVFSNIITNAMESIQRVDTPDGKVQIQADLVENNGVEMVHVKIIDDGAGIEPENIQSIFQRGTSSKPIQSGLGLHWCANSIAAQHGRLYAESKGAGLGATFHLLVERKHEG